MPYNKFKNDSKKLAEEVLMEIPTQVLKYYEMNNILQFKRKIINIINRIVLWIIVTLKK